MADNIESQNANVEAPKNVSGDQQLQASQRFSAEASNSFASNDNTSLNRTDSLQRDSVNKDASQGFLDMDKNDPLKAADKPGAQKASDADPAIPGDKPTDGKPSSDKPGEDTKPGVDGRPPEQNPSAPTDAPGAPTKPDEKPTDVKPADQSPAGPTAPTDVRPADQTPANPAVPTDNPAGPTTPPTDAKPPATDVPPPAASDSPVAPPASSEAQPIDDGTNKPGANPADKTGGTDAAKSAPGNDKPDEVKPGDKADEVKTNDKADEAADSDLTRGLKGRDQSPFGKKNSDNPAAPTAPENAASQPEAGAAKPTNPNAPKGDNLEVPVTTKDGDTWKSVTSDFLKKEGNENPTERESKIWESTIKNRNSGVADTNAEQIPAGKDLVMPMAKVQAGTQAASDVLSSNDYKNGYPQMDDKAIGKLEMAGQKAFENGGDAGVNKLMGDINNRAEQNGSPFRMNLAKDESNPNIRHIEIKNSEKAHGTYGAGMINVKRNNPGVF